MFVSVAESQQRNPVLEYCTGTWCQWCPCGHEIIRDLIVPNITGAIIVGYHGPANGSDPYSHFSGNSVISSLGFSGYPTGIVDRMSALISRTLWFNRMWLRQTEPATVQIGINKTYNDDTGELDATFFVEPLTQLTGQYNLSVILLEDSLVYPQTGNSSCTGGSNYVHDHVARAMINGYLGENLGAPDPWNPGETASKSYQYMAPATFVADRCHLVALVYKVGGPLNTSEIQQAEEWELKGNIVAVNEKAEKMTPSAFTLSQNYPNPFNPTTTISYTVSDRTFVSLKVFNALGEEVRTLVSRIQEPGNYPVTWSGEDNLGRDVPSGVFIYQMIAGQFSESKKMLLLK
jgi:hypothetical protein